MATRITSTPTVVPPKPPTQTPAATTVTPAATTWTGPAGNGPAGTFDAASVKAVISENGQPMAPLTDAALKNGLANVKLPLKSGAKGSPAVAVQYTLGRLGFFEGLGLADGKFGPKSAQALAAFQKSKGLPATGEVDSKTLAALDAAVSVDLRPPAAKAADPLAYLSDFKARGMSKIEFTGTPPKASWNEPRIQAEYGKFVKDYWKVLKDNRVECDCKSLNMLFMDKFRDKLKQDTGLALPLPKNGNVQAPQPTWTAMTDSKAAGFFKRFENLKSVRPGYDAAQAIQKLDPKASMLQGVNVRPGNLNANSVGRAATPVQAWDPKMDNKGDESISEVPVQKMQPGDVIFIDHGKGIWGHAVNVVDVERGPDGKVKRAIIATGSFDDMKDANGATDPRGGFEINNYTEEVAIDFDANGKIKGSTVTWSSEPAYLVDPRYSAHKLLMETKPGGKVILANWGARQ